MRFTLRGARLVDATMDLARGDVTVDGTRIQEVGEGLTGSESTIDASDMIVMPGFIEVHTHGGGGNNLHTTDVHEIHAYSRWVASTGVTAYLVTVVGTPNSVPETQLCTAVEAIESSQLEMAEPVGIFLEGPYISVKRRGAHPPIWLRTPNEAETERILNVTKGLLRLVTLAPELPGADEMIQRLLAAGVTVSMGHTDVNYDQAQEAIKKGITHMTHCFNAMRPLLHRDPGPIAAVMKAEGVLGEVIADGVHVHPAMVDALIRLLGPERVVVITDAQAGAGLPEGSVFEFAGQQASVLHGAVRLKDGALAGSILTLDKALRNILEMSGVSLSSAVRMFTLNPARSARVDTRKALLKGGYDADLLVFDKDLRLQATICRGSLTFATEQGRQQLKLLQNNTTHN